MRIYRNIIIFALFCTAIQSLHRIWDRPRNAFLTNHNWFWLISIFNLINQLYNAMTKLEADCRRLPCAPVSAALVCLHPAQECIHLLSLEPQNKNGADSHRILFSRSLNFVVHFHIFVLLVIRSNSLLNMITAVGKHGCSRHIIGHFGQQKHHN